MYSRIGCILCGLFLMTQVVAAVSVMDDEGKTVLLTQPAQRVVSLSPHVTELMYFIGAGKQLVGVTQYSDYPEQARLLPIVGDFSQLDLERVLVLKPDLIIVWSGGNPPKQVEKLKQAGIPIFYSHPRQLKDIPDSMIRFGQLTGHEEQAQQQALQWNQRLNKLKQQYRNRTLLRVFYQVSDMPLVTLNGKQMISEVIGLCGGINIFADMSVLAPHVGTEAVLAANPEVIVSTLGVRQKEELSRWQRYSQLDAVRYKNLFSIHPDWLNRPGPRIIDGVEKMCRQFDEARQNRQSVHR